MYEASNNKGTRDITAACPEPTRLFGPEMLLDNRVCRLIHVPYDDLSFDDLEVLEALLEQFVDLGLVLHSLVLLEKIPDAS